MRIPVFDARGEFEAHADEYLAAAERVLRSGRYILGPEVQAFEEEAGDYLGAEYAVGCASGTDALWLALRAADVGPGDGVITSAFTFFATASSILTVGATPILCDVDPATLNIDPRSVRAVLDGRSAAHDRAGVNRDRIRAIIPVHIFGQPADMHEILEIADDYNLSVIEDAAQAFGAEFGNRKAGTVGHLGCYSFFPTKNLGGFGDGGLVTTDEDDLAKRLRMLRNHGGGSKYANEIVGTNSRLDELQAALLRVRMSRIDELLEGRRRVAGLYDAAFEGSPVGRPVRASGRTHSFNLYVVRVPDRDRVQKELESKGIGTAVHYPSPVHLQPAIGAGYQRGDLPAAEQACAEVLSLPSSPSLTEDQVRDVAEAVLAAVGQRSAAG